MRSHIHHPQITNVLQIYVSFCTNESALMM